MPRNSISRNIAIEAPNARVLTPSRRARYLSHLLTLLEGDGGVYTNSDVEWALRVALYGKGYRLYRNGQEVG